MSKVLKPPATYEDLLQVPDHLVAELIDSELYTSPRPTGPQERAKGGTYSRLRWAFDDGEGPSGWWISTSRNCDGPARIEPFEAIEFPLARLWFPGAA